MKRQFTELIGACCLSVFLLLISTTGAFSQYCTSEASNTSDEWLSNVDFAGISNPSGSTGYSDFTNISGTVVPGDTYGFSGTISQTGTFTELITVFIDWDQSFTFEASERYEMGSCASDGCVLTGDIDVPGAAAPGETRMRVIQMFSSAPATACELFTWGEVEDYSIFVESDDCTPPDFDFEVVNDCDNDTYNVEATINSLGTSSFITMHLSRSDEASISNVTIVPPLVGQTITIASGIPFGVSVNDSIAGGNPICALIRNFEANICPATNDEICEATVMICGDTLTDQPFVGATQSIDDDCFGSGEADVWYTFTSDGSEKYRISETSTSDVVVSVYSGSDCGDTTLVQACVGFPENFTATEAGTYFFRVRVTANELFHTMVLECIPFDCPAELVDFGDPCDDGDPGTVNDVYQDDCSCEGDPQLANDEACDAIELFCGDDLSDQPFAGSTQSVDDDCSGSGTGDVWYKFTSDGSQTYFIEETESDVVVDLWTGNDCGELESISDCVDIGENFTVTEAGTYYFRIRPWGSATTYGVALTCTPFDCPGLGNFGGDCDDGDPSTINDEITDDCGCAGYPEEPNDAICDALTLSCGDTLSQSYLGATPSPEGDCADGVTNDLWYQVTVEEGLFYQVGFSGTTFANSSTAEVLVADECTDSLIQFVPCTAGIISFYLDSAATYFIRAQPTSGIDSLDISLNCYEIPDNPDCSSATEIECGETYNGATAAAPQHDADQPFCGTSAPSIFNTGVWFTYSPETDIVMNFDLSGSSFDTKLFLYSNTCDSLVCVDGDDDSGEGVTSLISDTLYEGTTYYLYVTGIGNSRGEYTLNATCIDLECSPTISSLALVDQNGTPLGECVDLDVEYYVEVTLAGGLDDGYNVSLNGGSPTIIDPNGTGIVGPGISPNPGNISVTGVTDETCAVQGSIDVPVCPPTFDVPCNAIPLTVDGGASEPYSNQYAGVDEAEPSPEGTSCTTDWCSFAADLENSIWFEIAVPGDVGRLNISSCNEGTTFDTQIAAYSVGNCTDYSTFSLIGANDDQVGTCQEASSLFASTLEVCVEPGSTIYVQLDGYNGAFGDAVLTVESIDDEVCDCVLPSVSLESYAVCTEDSSSYSVDIIIDDLGSSDFVTITYTLDGEEVVLDNVTEDLTVEGVALGTTFTATLVPGDEACASEGELSGSVFQGEDACDPDCEGTLGGDVGPGSPCDADGVPGAYDPDCECVPAPSNDLCSDAIPVSCGAYEVGTNVGATLNLGCDGDSRPTVWYSFTAESAGNVILSTCNSETDFDTDLNVYTGTCDSLTCFEGFEGNGYVDGNSTCSFQSFAGEGSFEAEAGVVYYIAVTGYFPIGSTSAWEGNFALSVTCDTGGATLNGTVNWNSDCGDRDGTVTLYEPDTDTEVASYAVTVAADGSFSIPEVELGTYDVIVNFDGYLAKGMEDVEFVAGSNSLDIGVIVNGDINNDGATNLSDVSIVNASFGSVSGDGNYSADADLNCDGSVNLTDISIINAGFNQIGDSAPLNQ